MWVMGAGCSGHHGGRLPSTSLSEYTPPFPSALVLNLLSNGFPEIVDSFKAPPVNKTFNCEACDILDIKYAGDNFSCAVKKYEKKVKSFKVDCLMNCLHSSLSIAMDCYMFELKLG